MFGALEEERRRRRRKKKEFLHPFLAKFKKS